VHRVDELLLATYHLVRGKTSRMLSPASAGASAGISNMHDELNSRKPGDAIASAVVNAPVSSPEQRQMITKTQASKPTANAVVTNRGPRMEGVKCLSTCVTKNVWSGG